jgi:hypothetical protein
MRFDSALWHIVCTQLWKHPDVNLELGFEHDEKPHVVIYVGSPGGGSRWDLTRQKTWLIDEFKKGTCYITTALSVQPGGSRTIAAERILLLSKDEIHFVNSDIPKEHSADPNNPKMNAEMEAHDWLTKNVDMFRAVFHQTNAKDVNIWRRAFDEKVKAEPAAKGARRANENVFHHLAFFLDKCVRRRHAPRLGTEGVTTKPPRDELREMSVEQLRAIPDFTITHETIGSVRWPGNTDVTDLDLDDLVAFDEKEGKIIVYPRGATHEVGEKLNKHAIFTLFNTQPKDEDGNVLVNPDLLKRHEEDLQRFASKIGATFITYYRDSGKFVYEKKDFDAPSLV